MKLTDEIKQRIDAYLESKTPQEVSDILGSYGLEIEQDLSQEMELQMRDNFKENLSDYIILIRFGDSYKSYREDSIPIKNIDDINTTVQKIKDTDTSIVSFPACMLNNVLESIINKGLKIAIYDKTL